MTSIRQIKIYAFFLMVMAVVASNAYSQEIKHFKKNINAFIQKFDDSKNLANRSNILDILNSNLDIKDKNYQLLSENRKGTAALKKDKLGLTHERFIQFYKGIRVEGSDVRIHYKDDKVVSANGEYANNINLDVNPVLGEDEAINQAKEFIQAKKYRWEIPEENKWLQETRKDPNATFYPQAELVICKNKINPADSIYHLAYKVNISAVEPLSDSYVFVDAKNGLILNNLSRMKDVTANAATRYSGTRTIETTSNYPNNGFLLLDIIRGNDIETKNMQCGTNYSNAVNFVDNDNNWTATEYNNTNKDNAALDAHWGMMMAYDFFLNVLGRNSYDDNGAKITSYVHYGSDQDMAFYDPTSETFSFGDGGANPLTPLDIVAHEFGHAVCDYTANLYYQVESGAISEGLSDIWGACVEHYAAPSKDMWAAGQDLYQFGVAERSFSDPNIYLQPDTYHGDYFFETEGCTPDGNPTHTTTYNDYCGVHTNSGIVTHWFYILVNGGNGENDLSHSYQVDGVSLDKATEITYNTELSLTAGSTFDYMREVSIDEAAELFGDYSPEVISTTNAWYAVGVGEEFECDDWQYVFYEDYTANTVVTACNLEIGDVTVSNGAKLTLDVVHSTIITGPFEVASSSQLEVK